MVITLLWLYISRNFAKIVGLECPEPLANLYSRSYFRATWVTTALDAGFWTAMKIRRKWLRDLASIMFSLYYLIAAEQADEKVRRVRATLTVEHLRVSWNKSTTPYLSLFSGLVRPRLMRYPPRAIRIPRPRGSSYREPVHAWLYFNGPLSLLRDQSCIVLDVPGGGFVAMSPRTADDKLLAWGGKMGIPILSLDYKKAPEYPYPYALNECYDVYQTIMTSRGRCLGFSGQNYPRIVITGESAGGNLAASLTLMVLQSGCTDNRKWHGEDALPPPEGLVLVYPALDMNTGSWMSEEQMSLIQERGVRKTNANVLRRKSEDYYRLTPSSSRRADEDMRLSSPVYDYFNHKASSRDEVPSITLSAGSPESTDLATQAAAAADNQPKQIRTRLAVTSMLSYFNDRVLTPEMMRAMIILYIGPHNRPDFTTDFLLSPILAPEALLARFPKTYFLTGERDPLVDDTMIFAGRIRQAKLHRFHERQELGLEKAKVAFNEKEHVEVTLIPGISHGFLNFSSIFPDGWKHIYRCSRWIQELFENAELVELKKSTSSLTRPSDRRQSGTVLLTLKPGDCSSGSVEASRRSSFAESSADEDRPLEMSVGKFTPVRPPPYMNGSVSGRKRASTSSSPSDSASHSTDRESEPEPGNSGTSSSNGSRNPKNGNSTSSNTDNQNKNNHPATKPDHSAASNPSNTQSPRPPVKNRPKARTFTLGLSLRSNYEDKSLTRLPSEEDLLGRRMEGIAGGLMGLGEGVRTP
jgi:acetyl esterase/lipase